MTAAVIVVERMFAVEVVLEKRFAVRAVFEGMTVVVVLAEEIAAVAVVVEKIAAVEVAVGGIAAVVEEMIVPVAFVKMSVAVLEKTVEIWAVRTEKQDGVEVAVLLLSDLAAKHSNI